MGRRSTSHHRRKRKAERSGDRSSETDRSASESPQRKVQKSGRTKEREVSPLATSIKKNVESLSIQETNKLRAQLGLAPLEVESEVKVDESGESNDLVYKEDGFEFMHRKAENLAEKKRTTEVKEKLQVQRDKRKIYEKVLRVKGITESDTEEDAADWVNKSRKLEEEKKRADERAKILDEMDADFGVESLINEETARKKTSLQRKKIRDKSSTAGLVVGHAKEDLLQNQETVLVLDDKGVLDEGDEVLVNPNILENKRHQRNVELRKKKNPYEPYSEEFDEFGMPKHKDLLSKYDEELDGEERKMFRLDEAGEIDVEKEREELEMKRKLFMANKKVESLDTQKYMVGSEYYTEEEMLSFRKPKNKKERKLRKRKEKTLKADDLLPDAETEAELAERKARLAARRQGTLPAQMNAESVKVKDESKLEEGELDEEEDKKDHWRVAETTGIVDLQKLNEFAKQVDVEDEDDDDDLVGGVELSNVVLEDDAEDELNVMLDRARRLKQMEVRKESDADAALRVHEILKEQAIKEEPMEVDGVSDSAVVIDSTMEYCRNLGEIPTYGLAGNRKDAIDLKDFNEPVKPTVMKVESEEEEEERPISSKVSLPVDVKGKWTEASVSTSAVKQKGKKKELESSDDDEEAYNVLGEERDVTKGVAEMLKSASEKGYLDTGKEKRANGPSLKHLESKRFSQIETSRYDIEEKYTKKLERMGTTGTGPIRPFPEKSDYKPEISINYVDEKGKEMESKDAFRVLSWKFHGKGPGKKQIEKRQAKQEKKELMKKMNSMDTPLGTLNKQLKKQEVLQTPYIILSGSGRDTGAPLKKD